MSSEIRGPFSRLHNALLKGELNRRDFIERAVGLGMSAGVALMITDAAAQSATPEATAVAAEGVIPSVNTEGQTRGEGGEVKILQWQAPSQLNGVVATGDKDNLAAGLVQESLMVRLADGMLAPQLVTQIPSTANGDLAEDLTSVTFRLKEGVLWSDGEPLTAADIAFTIEWILDVNNAATTYSLYEPIAEKEVVDDLTIKITYADPNPTWADAFTGMGSVPVLPKHVLEGADQSVTDAFRSKPIGTGPYVVEEFSANDQVTYAINENYRESNKPFFSRVVLKGGGDAQSAARASIQTGEFDYAWNLAVEPDLLRDMENPDNPGELVTYGGLTIERMNLNFSDPNTEVDGQRSEMNTPHPILSDLAVRKAITIGTNRTLMSEQFYFGPVDEPPVQNVLSGIPSMESPNTELVYDPEAAKALLDEAGWVMDGDFRAKDGVALKLVHFTTVSAVRQKIQAVFKQNMKDIGIDVDIQSVDSAIFFDNAAGNEQNNSHFYQDINQFASGVGAPPPVAYMIRWYSGENGREIAQKSNNWTGRNLQRYINPEYDAIYSAARIEPDPAKSAEMFIQLNDILFNDAAVLPLVRYGSKAGVIKTLNRENLALSGFEFSYWNIANWNRV
ncbi:MAG: peptide ABC transporter substrate-binding protein [Thermomicrobiales bacterium]|nr:peptide ABC transporter substrate-binding protein [Thermomicrobiales bacterium]